PRSPLFPYTTLFRSLHEAVHRKWHLREFADRNQGSIDRDRSDRDIDARSIGQAGIDGRGRFVDPAANIRDNLLHDTHQMSFVLRSEEHTSELQSLTN